MSELNIKVRKSQDNGSTFRATPDTLYMGGVGSAKVDTLHFEVPEEWAGCAITLHVQRLSGALPDPQMLDENNCVVVDRRWTQEKQGSWMLLAVDENGYIAMTKPGQYTCYETIDTNSTTETITPSVYEQFVADVKKWGQTAVDAAAKAKSSEENAADSASASADFAAAAARSKSAAEWRATKAADSASAADRAKTDAQTAAQQSEASAKKAGKALSDTITAKEDALKAIGDKQTTATQAVDTARDKALRQVESSTEAAQTAATQAVDTARDKALQQVKASTEAAQTTATQAVDTARDKALQQVEASTEAAKTAAREAAASAGNADQRAQEAAGSLQELKDGIAAGDFKGKPGNDGKSPVVTVTAIENGHRISITDKDGTKTIDVLNGKDGKDGTQIDDTTVGADAWSSKHIVDMLCPPISETGNPVQCYPVAGYPLGCKVSWEPTQEGSGEPSPDNVRPIKGRDSVTVERCGENLLNIKPFNKDTYKGITYEYVPDSGIHISGTATTAVDSPTFAVGHLPPGKYYGLDAGACLAASIVVQRNGSGLWLNAKGVFEILAGDTIKYWYMIVTNGTTVDKTVYPYIVPGTTAPTTYAPYTGQTATLTLPRTIYGGTMDAVTGEGQETWKLLTLDGTESWNTWGLNANNPAVTGFYTYDIKDYDNINTKGICSHSAATGQDVWGGRAAGIGFASVGSTPYFIYSIPTSLLPDISAGHEVATFKAYLAAQYAAGTPVQVCYKLAEPAPFTSTGAQPIPALSGTNTVLTDADSATVTGRADPIKRITDLEDAVASMTTT